MREPRTILQLVKAVICKKLNNLNDEGRHGRLSVSTPVLASEERYQKKRRFKQKYYSQKIRSIVADNKKMIYRKRRHHNSCPDLMREVGMLDYLDLNTMHMFQDFQESEEHLELIEVYLE